VVNLGCGGNVRSRNVQGVKGVYLPIVYLRGGQGGKVEVVEEGDDHDTTSSSDCGEDPMGSAFGVVVVSPVNTGSIQTGDITGGGVRVLSVNVGKSLGRGDVEGVAGGGDARTEGEEVGDGAIEVEGAGDGLSFACFEGQSV